ncbi:hypothetical protein ISCGN_016433 [Ixodes scapularis]
MDVVQVEGQELRPDEFGEGSGWCEIKRDKKRADSAMESAKTQQQGHQQKGATSTLGISMVADKAAKYERKNARKVSQIAMVSRMPDLPTDDYRVVVRPRGGFNVSDHKTDHIYCCLRSAAKIGREAAEEDSICLNVRQNVVVLSTPSEDRAYKYGAITKLRIREREYEASAYRAAPENTSKGLIRGISKDETPADIVRSLITKRNPSVLHAKRMGNTDNVIILFNGFHVPRYVYYRAMLVRCTLYKKQVDVCHECGRLGHRADVCPSPNDKICRGCGCSNPPSEHRCEPKCLLCGKGHVTGDRKCKAKYKIPYLVKRRQWERRIREEEAAAAEAYGNGYNSSCSSSRGYYYASEDRHLGNGKRRRSASRGASGGFLGIAGFPRVLGCIDGTHVAIKVSKKDKPVYLNRMGYTSINVQAVCDANNVVTQLTVKWPGSTHDSFMWRNCDVYEKCAGTAHDGWLLGDAGYSVQPWLMTPIRAPKDGPEEEYNKALTKTRQVTERTFGLLKSRFRCLDKSGGVLQYKPQICCRITVACVVLHNYWMRHHVSFNEPLVDLSEDEEEEEEEEEEDDDGVQPTAIARTRRARPMAVGASVRDALVRHAFT